MLRRISVRVIVILLFVVALALMTVVLQVSNTLRQREQLVRAGRNRSLALITNVSSVIQSVTPLITTLENITELDTRLTVLVQQNPHIAFMAVAWPDGTVLFHSVPAYKATTIEALSGLDPDRTGRVEVPGFGEVYLTASEYENPTGVGPQTYWIMTAVEAKAIDSALHSVAVSAIQIGAIVFAVIGVVVLIVFHLVVGRPLQRLQVAAQAYTAGDLSHRVKLGGPREFYQLAALLNQASSDVELINRTLEDRVEARTRDIQLAAQVAEQIATVFDPDVLLNQVVEAVKQTFGLYHAHVYLLDAAGDHLVLAAGAGEPGRIMKERGHSIPAAAEASLVARAAREKAPVVVPDTTVDETFLPNPLLPETRSEAALPLLLGTRVLGVLDVQSEVRNRFDAELVRVLNTMARQIAVAVDNARLFSTMERTSRRDQALNAVTQAMQGAQSIDEVLRVAARELGKALRVPYTAIELQLETEAPHSQTVNVAAHVAKIESAPN